LRYDEIAHCKSTRDMVCCGSEVNKMNDSEMLQAILDKVTSMDARLGVVESDMADMKTDITKINVTLENDVKTQLKLLGEGQQMVIEKFAKLDKVAEDVEEIKVKVTALEAVTKDNTAQIRDLRIVK
jgi:hypothetical protein